MQFQKLFATVELPNHTSSNTCLKPLGKILTLSLPQTRHQCNGSLPGITYLPFASITRAPPGVIRFCPICLQTKHGKCLSLSTRGSFLAVSRNVASSWKMRRQNGQRFAQSCIRFPWNLVCMRFYIQKESVQISPLHEERWQCYSLVHFTRVLLQTVFK